LVNNINNGFIVLFRSFCIAFIIVRRCHRAPLSRLLTTSSSSSRYVPIIVVIVTVRHHHCRHRHGTSPSGDVISVFSREGATFDRLPRGEGQNIKKKLYAKTQKITIFPNQGRGGNAHLCPPQMTSLSPSLSSSSRWVAIFVVIVTVRHHHCRHRHVTSTSSSSSSWYVTIIVVIVLVVAVTVTSYHHYELHYIKHNKSMQTSPPL